MENTENKELNTEITELEAEETELAEEAKETAPELKASTAAKREKKKAGRENKAARKAANQEDQKKSRPNNILIGVLIFGVLIGMFVFITGYNYFSKTASIEQYIADNGGEEAYGNITIDEFTTGSVTAKKNSMTINLQSNTDDEELEAILREAYAGDSADNNLKYIGAYFLGMMKPQVRGLSADATVTMNINGEEVKTVTLTYKEAKDILENGFEDEEADDDDDIDVEETDDVDEAEDEAEDSDN